MLTIDALANMFVLASAAIADHCQLRIAQQACEHDTLAMLRSDCRDACVTRGLIPVLMARLQEPKQKALASTVTSLIEAGAPVDASDPSLFAARPLHLAAASGNNPVLRALLRARPHLDAQDQYGATPLHQAVHNKRLKSTLLLLEAGADIYLVDGGGMSARHSLLSPGVLFPLLQYVAKRPKRADGSARLPCLYDLVQSLIKQAFPQHLGHAILDRDELRGVEERIGALRRLVKTHAPLIAEAAAEKGRYAQHLEVVSRAAAGLESWAVAAAAAAEETDAMLREHGDALVLHPRSATALLGKERSRFKQQAKLAALAAAAAGDVGNATKFRNAYARLIQPALFVSDHAHAEEGEGGVADVGGAGGWAGGGALLTETEGGGLGSGRVRTTDFELGLGGRGDVEISSTYEAETAYHRLVHDHEQLEYLLHSMGDHLLGWSASELPQKTTKLTRAQVAATAAAYVGVVEEGRGQGGEDASREGGRALYAVGAEGDTAAVEGELTGVGGGERRMEDVRLGVNLTDAQWASIEHWHNRFAHISPAGSAPGPAPLLSSKGKFEAADAAYADAEPSVAVVDDVLSEAALADLLEYARSSTVWHDTKRGYLGAYWSAGEPWGASYYACRGCTYWLHMLATGCATVEKLAVLEWKLCASALTYTSAIPSSSAHTCPQRMQNVHAVSTRGNVCCVRPVCVHATCAFCVRLPLRATPVWHHARRAGQRGHGSLRERAARRDAARLLRTPAARDVDVQVRIH